MGGTENKFYKSSEEVQVTPKRRDKGGLIGELLWMISKTEVDNQN